MNTHARMLQADRTLDASTILAQWRDQGIGVPGATPGTHPRYLVLPLYRADETSPLRAFRFTRMIVCLHGGTEYTPAVADCDEPIVREALKGVYDYEGRAGLLARFPDLDVVFGTDQYDTHMRAATYDRTRLGRLVWEMHQLAQAALDVAVAYGVD